MIIVRFTSGLGNQMFQYSLYSMLREQFPSVPVKADLSWFLINSEHQGFELKRIFERNDNPSFVLEKANTIDILRVTGRIPCMVSGKPGKIWNQILRYPNRLIRLFTGDSFLKNHIDQTGFEDNADIFRQIQNIDPGKNYYITGFFIEEIYYRDRMEGLRRALTFDQNLSEINKKYLTQIQSTQSVSIHVRRGDYLSRQYQNSFLSLSMEYYKKAVELVRQKRENPVFYIFSDDKKYIETAFDWLEPKVIVEGNTGKDSYRDLQLMSACDDQIIANSTFSIWAGLLRANQEGQVYYPAAYMKEKDSEVKTMKGWTRL